MQHDIIQLLVLAAEVANMQPVYSITSVTKIIERYLSKKVIQQRIFLLHGIIIKTIVSLKENDSYNVVDAAFLSRIREGKILFKTPGKNTPSTYSDKIIVLDPEYIEYGDDYDIQYNVEYIINMFYEIINESTPENEKRILDSMINEHRLVFVEP